MEALKFPKCRTFRVPMCPVYPLAHPPPNQLSNLIKTPVPHHKVLTIIFLREPHYPYT